MNLCCILSGYLIESDCTCELRWHQACAKPLRDKNSEFFDGYYNALADYHFLNAPDCPGVQKYLRVWKKGLCQEIFNERPLL